MGLGRNLEHSGNNTFVNTSKGFYAVFCLLSVSSFADCFAQLLKFIHYSVALVELTT